MMQKKANKMTQEELKKIAFNVTLNVTCEFLKIIILLYAITYSGIKITIQ